MGISDNRGQGKSEGLRPLGITVAYRYDREWMAIDLDFIYVRRLSPWASIESARRILAFETST